LALSGPDCQIHFSIWVKKNTLPEGRVFLKSSGRLDYVYVVCLRTLVAVLNFELYALVFLKLLVTL
jgi:hypothetical protein